MRHVRSFRVAVAVAAVTIGAAAAGQKSSAWQPAAGPKLVIILAVDQMRTDYLQKYSGGFTGGLKRLTHDGAWFTEAAYPFLNTVTCAGHGTIGTGNLPYRHGMILNAWYDREVRASRTCVEDADAKDFSYNGLAPQAPGSSAHHMLSRTLGEQMHARGGRSVSISLKPRSSIPLAGRRADAVVWFDDRGGWTTSTAYTNRPVPFVQTFVDANPIAADYGKVWERTLPESSYQNEDDGKGEGSGGGWSRTFPHALGTPGGAPDGAFYARWQRSPFADEYLQRMAAAAVDALQLGRGKTTDFLAVSFSSLDMVGHAYGPRSHEVQDMLVRLDLTIGRLLDHLDREVGAGNYVVALSSDHGVADIPEQSGGGRQSGRVVADALTKVLSPAIRGADHVRAVSYTDIYLSSTARQRLRRDRALADTVLETVRSLPATAAAFWGDELTAERARTAEDSLMRAAALSYHPGRSGDLIILPKENWLFATSVTTHGTHHHYDQRVPVIFYGAGVRAGRYAQPATPADIVPTLAALAAVGIGRTDGRVLTEATGGAR